MASTWLVFTFGVPFTLDTILFTLETALNESFIFITVKHTKVHATTYKKTMLMHKIAMPQPAVELGKLHSAILLRDAAPVRSCRADCRNIACSCGILSGNQRHPTPSEDSSDLKKTLDIRCRYRKFVFTVVRDIVNKIRYHSLSAFNLSLTPDRRGCNLR